jgi:hypothetical protein
MPRLRLIFVLVWLNFLAATCEDEWKPLDLQALIGSDIHT